MKNVVILISGHGSNMEALIAARDAGELPVNIAAVISNRPDARGLETAAQAGIVTRCIDHAAFASREGFHSVGASLVRSPSPFVSTYRTASAPAGSSTITWNFRPPSLATGSTA